MPSQFQGKTFLITYPQSALNKDAILTFIRAKESIQFARIGQEQHADGGTHFHCLVYFASKQRFSERAFDVAGEHPNIQPVGKRTIDWNRVHDYCAKEDPSPTDWGTPRHASNVWAAVANAASRDEALELLRTEKPRDYVLQQRNIDYFLDKVHPVRQTSSFVPRPLDSFQVPPSIDEWLALSF